MKVGRYQKNNLFEWRKGREGGRKGEWKEHADNDVGRKEERYRDREFS